MTPSIFDNEMEKDIPHEYNGLRDKYIIWINHEKKNQTEMKIIQKFCDDNKFFVTKKP
jgi:hypothetical protein